jgi:hypothetical protein
MFFALVEPDIAEPWRDKALSELDGYRAGVRSPMWDRFYTHMAYALPASGRRRTKKKAIGRLLRSLMAHLRAEPKVWSVLRVPGRASYSLP